MTAFDTSNTTTTTARTTMLSSFRPKSLHQVFGTSSTTTTSSSSISSFGNLTVTSIDNHYDNTTPDLSTLNIDKDLVQQYGHRILAAKRSLGHATRRVIADDAEFAALQAGLRQGRGLLTDAWMKQNLVGLLHRHANQQQARHAAAALSEVSSTCTRKTSLSPTSHSPTTVLQSLSLDAHTVHQHVASPPLLLWPFGLPP